MALFTYDIQRAGYPFEKFDEMGEVGYEGFVEAFDNFPWLHQMRERAELEDGCSATLSVKNDLHQIDLWVSIADDKGSLLFLVGYVAFKKKKSLFGLGPEKNIKWVEIYEVKAADDVKGLFKMYFNQEFEPLHQRLSLYRKFDEMKAYLS